MGLYILVISASVWVLNCLYPELLSSFIWETFRDHQGYLYEEGFVLGTEERSPKNSRLTPSSGFSPWPFHLYLASSFSVGCRMPRHLAAFGMQPSTLFQASRLDSPHIRLLDKFFLDNFALASRFSKKATLYMWVLFTNLEDHVACQKPNIFKARKFKTCLNDFLVGRSGGR